MATAFPPFDGSAPKRQRFAEPPEMGIDPNRSYSATMTTSMGEIVIALDSTRAPRTVNNFVFLALHHYFDGVTFHRIIPGFVCQGGDPGGTGRGGPGYVIDDELPGRGDYEIGSVVMANAGPNTNGSQFFLISGSNGVALPPSYSLFGRVVEGLDVLDAMQHVPTGPGDKPLTDVVIVTTTIDGSHDGSAVTQSKVMPPQPPPSSQPPQIRQPPNQGAATSGFGLAERSASSTPGGDELATAPTTEDDELVDRLTELLKRAEVDLDDRTRLRSVLADAVLVERQRRLLAHVVDADGVPRLAANPSARGPLVRALVDDHGIQPEAAAWATSTWLRVVNPDAPPPSDTDMRGTDSATATVQESAGAGAVDSPDDQQAPAGWYADPSGRFELRHWNGTNWTEHVAKHGQQFTDPPTSRPNHPGDPVERSVTDSSDDGPAPEGWYVDPSGRDQLRYWNGVAWTGHISRDGQKLVDPTTDHPGSIDWPGATASDHGSVPEGWYADPSGRFELRHWDGTYWTDEVSRDGQRFTDPPYA